VNSTFVLCTGELKPSKSWLSQQKEGVNALLHPFSDKAINAKLLALCLAQALCSVATLIHDTYLPIYLQDVLGEARFSTLLCPSESQSNKVFTVLCAKGVSKATDDGLCICSAQGSPTPR